MITPENPMPLIAFDSTAALLTTDTSFWVALLVAVAVFFLLGMTLLWFNRSKALRFYRSLLYNDALTEIRNITYLRENFNDILIAFDQDVSMYYINLDNFKNYNDLLGHALANRLLYQVAERLTNLVKPYGTVYRMHSDHFVLLYPTQSDNDNAFAETLIRTIKMDYPAGVHTVKLSASIGRYAIQHSTPRFHDCLLRSELALQEAKTQGKDRVVYYSSAIKRRNHDAFAKYRTIKEALKEKRFFLEYQPILCSASRKIVGAEALIRLRDDRKIYYPQEIIAYAEKYHLIEDIDRFVIAEAFEAFTRFEKAGSVLDFMSVNVSATEIKNLSFVDYVVATAEAFNIPPEKITIEFTETQHPEDFTQEATFIKTLQAHGFKVAIDDFGSGYSSMVRLSQNRLDRIKIDRSFITGITDNRANQQIVEAIINLSKTFGLEVIVEGVETENDLNYLATKDIKYMQGYFFYRSLTEKVCIGKMLQ